jgi:protein gp37
MAINSRDKGQRGERGWAKIANACGFTHNRRGQQYCGIEAQDAAHRIRTLANLPGDWTKFISFEPLLGEVTADLSEINWIIIGARTNPTQLPNNNWVQGLILEALQDDVPIFLKDSIQSYWPEQWRHIPGGPQQ